MTILDIIILVLILSWIGGFSLSIGGGFIHLLLAIAVVVLIFRLLRGTKIV